MCVFAHDKLQEQTHSRILTGIKALGMRRESKYRNMTESSSVYEEKFAL